MLYDEPRGEIICEDCGLVANSLIFSREPEWRAYSSEEEKAKVRVGLPPSILNNREMRTVIGGKTKDSYGKTLDTATQAKFARLSQMDERIQDRTTRNLKSALMELKRIKSHLYLSDDICEAAVLLYRLALNNDLIKGRSVIGMVSAATYLACRKKQAAITLKDTAEVANINTKELGRCIRIFLQNININNTSPDPVTLVNRLGENLGLTMFTRKVAIDILIEAREKRLTMGKIPMSLAAAAVYIASIQTGERRTQQQIATPARTTPVTIRNRFKELAKGLGLDHFEVKRGAAAKPVIIENPTKWVRNQRQTTRY
jgi:transcription initiation factor TFIIB